MPTAHIQKILQQNLKLPSLALFADPETFKEAMSSPDSQQWKAAMDLEFDSLVKNNTWTVTFLPPGRKAIKSKWIFKRKTEADGSPGRNKARLVAQGFSQRYGVDYDETFAPVTNMATLRIMIGLRAQGYHVRQLDVDTAYLNAKLNEDIYLTQPKGFHDNTELVCKLNKAIYGLKQAGLAWYQHLSGVLFNMGFRKATSDTCLFVKHKPEPLLLAIYVDDIVIASKSHALITKFEEDIRKHLKIKILGDIKHILGWKIDIMDNGRSYCQEVQDGEQQSRHHTISKGTTVTNRKDRTR